MALYYWVFVRFYLVQDNECFAMIEAISVTFKKIKKSFRA